MKNSIEENILEALKTRLSYKEALFGFYDYMKTKSLKLVRRKE